MHISVQNGTYFTGIRIYMREIKWKVIEQPHITDNTYLMDHTLYAIVDEIHTRYCSEYTRWMRQSMHVSCAIEEKHGRRASEANGVQHQDSATKRPLD